MELGTQMRSAVTSSGHDYMLHFATTSETTLEFLQKINAACAQAQLPVKPTTWLEGRRILGGGVIQTTRPGLFPKFQSYTWTRSTCRRQMLVPTWSVSV